MEDEKNIPKIKIRLTAEQREYFKTHPAEYEGLKKDLIAERKEKLANPKQKEKKFNWNWGTRSELNKGKKPEMIVALLLNLKGGLEIMPTRIYGGNFLVIRNHIYEFSPRNVHSMNKWKIVIAREWDRKLVGHDDYDEVVLADWTSQNPGRRINIDDPVLIKAVILAHLSEKQKEGNSKWLWIVGFGLIGLIAAFFIFGGKSKPAAAVTTPGIVAGPAPGIVAGGNT